MENNQHYGNVVPSRGRRGSEAEGGSWGAAARAAIKCP